jgi:hypothetical protein
MTGLYPLCSFMVQFFGPLMLACLVLMYISTARHMDRPPSPREIILSYVRYNMKTRRHAGLLTYLFILSSLLFVLSALGLLAGYLLR